MLISSFACAGCLLSDPAAYEGAAQAIVLLAQTANPVTTQILPVTVGITYSLSVDVRSEDAGEDLIAFLYRKYALAGRNLLSTTTVPASTWANKRRITLLFSIDADSNISGCQPVTMAVTHLSNAGLTDSEDLALLTWWLNVYNPNAAQTNDSLDDCPQPEPLPTQGTAP